MANTRPHISMRIKITATGVETVTISVLAIPSIGT